MFSKLLRSFKSKILLSFFAFIRIFILWICIYFWINNKQTELDHFTYHLTQQQNLNSESNRYLENFVLSGYQQPLFYSTFHQEDIDSCQDEQMAGVHALVQLKKEADDNHIKIDTELARVQRLHAEYTDSVKALKQIVFDKGFKDCGMEGTMRKYAHYLEDSTDLSKVIYLMFRRKEKDFIIRNEEKYVTEFNALADSLIQANSLAPKTIAALVNYKRNFNQYANYTRRLDLNAGDGLYRHVQHIIDQLDIAYRKADKAAARETERLNGVFRMVLVVSFILLCLASLYLSAILSNNLTKDVGHLNAEVAAFVERDFKDENDADAPLVSKIKEVQQLHHNFLALKTALKKVLAAYESTVEEEKQITAELTATIDGLKERIRELGG